MAIAATTLVACGPSLPQLGKASIEEVIAAMTLEEKRIWLSVRVWQASLATVPLSEKQKSGSRCSRNNLPNRTIGYSGCRTS